MRLVKKTVNQDDVETYHLFFADDKGTAGTDMTFFDFPGIPQSRHGNNRNLPFPAYALPNDPALEYWLKRFDHFGVNARVLSNNLVWTLLISKTTTARKCN